MKDRVRLTHISASCPVSNFNFGPGRPVPEPEPHADERYEHTDSDDEGGFNRQMKARAMTMPAHSLTVLSLMQSFPGDPSHLDQDDAMPDDDLLDLPDQQRPRVPKPGTTPNGDLDNGDLQFSFSFS